MRSHQLRGTACQPPVQPDLTGPGCSSPAISRRSVVLPHDDGPTRATYCPRATSRLMSRTTALPPYRFVTAFRRTIYPSGGQPGQERRHRNRRLSRRLPPLEGSCPKSVIDDKRFRGNKLWLDGLRGSSPKAMILRLPET